jgi:hypothetical protein
LLSEAAGLADPPSLSVGEHAATANAITSKNVLWFMIDTDHVPHQLAEKSIFPIERPQERTLTKLHFS